MGRAGRSPSARKRMVKIAQTWSATSVNNTHHRPAHGFYRC